MAYNGWCRYKDSHNYQHEISLSRFDADSFAECTAKCFTNQTCSAVSYEYPKARNYDNCKLLKGKNPYTMGSGRSNTKCFVFYEPQRGTYIAWYIMSTSI